MTMNFNVTTIMTSCEIQNQFY